MTATTTSTVSASVSARIVGWAILEMHQSQLRTMVRGMGLTEADAWRDAFGPNGRPRKSWARAEALDAEEWEYWQQYYYSR